MEDSTGVSSQTFELYGPDGLAYTAQLATGARSITLDSSTYRLDNLTGYSVRLSVTGGSSLSTAVERSFGTDYLEPAFPEPEVGVQYDDLSVSLEMRAGEFVPNLWVNPRGTSSGVTITDNDDGSLTINGSSTGQVVINSPKVDYIKPNTTYTASIDHPLPWTTSVNGSFALIGANIEAGYNAHFGWKGRETYTFTTGETLSQTPYFQYWVVGNNPGTPISGTYRIMLNEGTEPAPWQPPGLVLPATEYFTVERQNDDGTRWLVGDGLAEGESCIDPLPPLNVDVHYLVTAHAASGTTATSDSTARIDRPWFALNFGADAGISLIMRYGTEMEEEGEHQGELYHFADGGEGGGLPEFYGTGEYEQTPSYGFRLSSAEEYRELRALSRRYAVGWLRDPLGNRLRGRFTWGVEVMPGTPAFEVSLDADELVFQEAANG